MSEPSPDLPPEVAAALARARSHATRVDEAEAHLDDARLAWYRAVADAVEVARESGIATAQALVARELNVSRQRVSELARRPAVAG